MKSWKTCIHNACIHTFHIWPNFVDSIYIFSFSTILFWFALHDFINFKYVWFYEFQIKSVLENQKQIFHLEKDIWILNGYNSLYNKNNTAFLCSLEIFKKSTCCSTNEDLTELHPDQEGWKKRERERKVLVLTFYGVVFLWITSHWQRRQETVTCPNASFTRSRIEFGLEFPVIVRHLKFPKCQWQQDYNNALWRDNRETEICHLFHPCTNSRDKYDFSSNIWKKDSPFSLCSLLTEWPFRSQWSNDQNPNKEIL